MVSGITVELDQLMGLAKNTPINSRSAMGCEVALIEEAEEEKKARFGRRA